MKLSELAGADIVLSPDAADMEISGLSADSRAVKPGYLFAALPGSQVDGAKFIPQALENGACAVLLSPKNQIEGEIEVPVILDPDPRRRLALMAASFFGRAPGTIVAITGTNGKTSVASFVRQIWRQLGNHAASLGTVGIVSETPSGDLLQKKLSHTTPEPVELHERLAELADLGVTHLAVEASSHGLEQRRLDGIKLAGAAFTNISRDHLDYHHGFEDYLAQKMRLFGELDYVDPKAPGVVCADSDGANTAVDEIERRGLSPFTIGRKGADIRLVTSTRDSYGQNLNLRYLGNEYIVRLPLIGEFQISNALVAAGLVIGTGGVPEAVFSSLEHLKGAKGRLEHVGTTKEGAPILVDYAHTPDALSNALQAVRPYADRKLVVIFGCGGDRDKGKRPEMGRAAIDGADQVIVTDDNPRSEDPATIRADILAGAKGATEIGDRNKAILSAISELRKGDVLLIAGKGHETGQIVGKEVIPFSDHDAVASALADQAHTTSSTGES